MESLLKAKALSRNFGDLKAVSQVSFDIESGQIVSVIGPNGAGKSTLLNLITQVLPLSSGEVWYKDHDLTRQKPHELVALGISRTYQNVRLFDVNGMTVLDNVMVGMHRQHRHGLFAASFRSPRARAGEAQMRERALEILDFVGIPHLAELSVTTLSFGDRRLVELSRALAAKPELLVLDEPAAGLNDVETETFSQLIEKIKQDGVTVLLVEHHMGLVMNISDKIVVLNYGQKLVEGTPAEIQSNPEVIEAYLGKEGADAIHS